MCCACGAVRTIAVTAAPRRPPGAPDLPEAWWLTWLRCSGPCKAITAHALINDAGPESSPRDGREEDNRRTDTARRVLQRRLAGLEAEGIKIEWVAADSLELPTQFPAEIECQPGRLSAKFTVSLLSGADPADLLAAVEEAERLLDNPGDRFKNPRSAYLLPGRCGSGGAS